MATLGDSKNSTKKGSSNQDQGSESTNETHLSLEEEEILHQNKAGKREETFRSIILNEGIETAGLKCIFYLFGITLIGVLSTLPQTLIPAHDLIRYPEFWYEILIHGIFAIIPFYIFTCVLTASLLNLEYLLLKENIFFVTLIGTITFYACLLSSFYIWTQILDYQFPIPFLGLIITLSMHVFARLLIWIRFPDEWRRNNEFKKRILFYLSYTIFTIVLVVWYKILLRKIQMADEYHQPFVAFALPITRELSIWINSKFVENCSNGDKKGGRILLQYTMATSYTILLCYVIGAFATETTSWTLVGLDFSINIFNCVWIVWTRKRNPNNVQKQIDLLQDLVIYELVEFHSPLSFILVISVAFYGPNAEIFGNVGNSYWGFSAIEDIHLTLMNMGRIFLFDFCSTLVSACILWLTCEISLWKAMLELQKEFSSYFSLALGYYLIVVCKLIFEPENHFCINISYPKLYMH